MCTVELNLHSRTTTTLCLIILEEERRSTLSFVLSASSETLYQNPNLFKSTILYQNYQVSLNLLSSNCQTPPTDSNENSQNTI